MGHYLFCPKTMIVAHKEFCNFSFFWLGGGSSILGKGSVCHNWTTICLLATTYLLDSTSSAPLYRPSIWSIWSTGNSKTWVSSFPPFLTHSLWRPLLPVPTSNTPCPNSPQCLRPNLNTTHIRIICLSFLKTALLGSHFPVPWAWDKVQESIFYCPKWFINPADLGSIH